MREDTYIYPFFDKIYFASERPTGNCYLTHRKAIIQIGDELYEIILDKCFAEAHLLNSKTLLLVRNQNFGLLEEIFSFDMVILDIHSKDILSVKEFKLCDFRGIIVNENQIVVGFNRYDAELERNFDPDGLNYDPPCSEFANSAEIVRLDFNLQVIDVTTYDKELPDDLILQIRRTGKEEEIVFNHSPLYSNSDRILWKENGVVYLLRNKVDLVKCKDGLEEEVIYHSIKPVVGIGIDIKDSLVEFHLYLQDCRKDLVSYNSLKFILTD